MKSERIQTCLSRCELERFVKCGRRRRRDPWLSLLRLIGWVDHELEAIECELKKLELEEYERTNPYPKLRQELEDTMSEFIRALNELQKGAKAMPTKYTELVEKVKELDAHASPGPWIPITKESGDWRWVQIPNTTQEQNKANHDNDSQFVAGARELMPKLADAVAELLPLAFPVQAAGKRRRRMVHNYFGETRGWGHDFEVNRHQNEDEVNAGRIEVTGWGLGIRPGDYIVFELPGTVRHGVIERGSDPRMSCRSLVTRIEYRDDPQDLFYATFDSNVTSTEEEHKYDDECVRRGLRCWQSMERVEA